MNNEQFEAVFENAVTTARALLVTKAKEYASDKDRLHNFKAAAGALNVTPELALRGMSTKHTISVNDMVKDPDKYTAEQWQEKLGDEFNYIILLMALISERENKKTTIAESSDDEDARTRAKRLGFNKVGFLKTNGKKLFFDYKPGELGIDVIYLDGSQGQLTTSEIHYHGEVLQ